MSDTATIRATSPRAGVSAEFVRPGRGARERLHARIQELQRRPLDPVTVVVPTRLAGIALRRELARTGAGIAGVRILLLAQVTELLAAGATAGRHPLTEQVRHEFLRLALEPPPEALRSAAQAPATARALDRSLARWREATAADDDGLCDTLARAGRLPAALAAIHRRVRDLADGTYTDAQDVHAVAADVLATPAGAAAVRDDIGPVVVYLPLRLTPAEQGVVRALAAVTPVEILAPVTGDAPADDATVTLLREAFGVEVEPPPCPPILPDRVVAAPDADEEARVAVRSVMAALEAGVPAERIAVLHRRADPYATILEDAFTRAGVPHNGLPTLTLGHTAVGRALVDLLAWPATDHGREAFLDWIGAAPITVDGAPAPVRRWARLTADAHVVRGRDDWHRRLTDRARVHRGELDTASPERRPRLQRTIEDLEHLDRYVRDLTSRLDGPTEHTWTGWSTWALALLDHVLGDARPDGRWTEPDVAAEETIRRTVSELAALDDVHARAAVTAPVDADTFRHVLERELGGPAGPVGDVGVGVHLGALDGAVGLEFDHLVLVSAVEGSLPPRPAEDAFLSDAVVSALREQHPGHPGAAALDTRRDRVAASRRFLATVLAGADHLTVTWARVDRRRQREQLPAPWLLQVAGDKAGVGRPLQLAELLRLEVDWYEDLRSHEAAVRSAVPAADAAEWRLQRILATADGDPALHPLLRSDPVAAQAVAVERARAAPVFGAYDAHVGPHQRLDELLAQPMSPTGLESYAACPRRYFFDRVLGLDVVESPRELLGASRRDIGSIVHDVLERYTREVPGPAAAEHRRLALDRIVAEVLDDATRRYPVGRQLLWARDRDEITVMVHRALVEEDQLRERYGVTHVEAEVGVGLAPHDPAPAELDLPSGRTLRFKGRVDRIDHSADGRTVVASDYKTGASGDYRGIDDDPVLRGRSLQGVVYALMAQARHPDADAIHAGYWKLSPPNHRPHHHFELGEHRDTVAGALDLIAEGISGGVFPAVPGEWDDYRKTYENCRFCAFDSICAAPGERERGWQRDAEAPEVAPVHRLHAGAYLPVVDPEEPA